MGGKAEGSGRKRTMALTLLDSCVAASHPAGSTKRPSSLTAPRDRTSEVWSEHLNT